MIFVGSGHLFCISSSPFSFPSFSLPFFSLQYDGKKGPGLPPLSLSSFESLAGTRVKYRGWVESTILALEGVFALLMVRLGSPG